MCSKGTTFEKRNVKVGVSDYFFAEIQEGLKEGEIVSLELPKEEREKKAQAVRSPRSRAAASLPPPAREPPGQRAEAAPTAGTASGSGSPASDGGPERQVSRSGRLEPRQQQSTLNPASRFTHHASPWPWSNSATSARSTASARRKSARWTT